MKSEISFKEIMIYSLKGAFYITKEIARAMKNRKSVEVAFIKAHVKLVEDFEKLYGSKTK
jgi:hypothetical protein